MVVHMGKPWVVHMGKPWVGQVFRATGGKALVWGKAPRIIKAHYITADGQRKASLLLASGA